ncbi:MAG: Gfo/Idh/MocA family oxidoreductase [Oscillospiraceae bacterium]|nr:Gfo/Idh/MocA family oxidoreductase [Oscillospiraceae bacterium]
MKIGILGTSDIAFRRFLPALKKCGFFEFAGVASRDISKTVNFTNTYGGKGYDGYEALLNDEEIDCVYIPLPPALHYEWAKKAIEHSKHVMLEKPFTTSVNDTSDLINLAHSKKLALHENYMFEYHNQIEWIRSKLPELGDLRLFRIDFGFPFRSGDDFRYNKTLGGGALLDCGGYTLKLAALLLGSSAEITDAALGYKGGFDVDIYGSATLRNTDGLIAQVSFGMDNSYRCSLDAWGSVGSLYTGRIFTAPDTLEPVAEIKIGSDTKEYKLPADDSFAKSIDKFSKCINEEDVRHENYNAIIKQAEIIKQFEVKLR